MIISKRRNSRSAKSVLFKLQQVVLSSVLCTVEIKSPDLFRKLSSEKLELFQRKETGKTVFLIGKGIIRMKTLKLSELNIQCINVKGRDHFLHFFPYLWVKHRFPVSFR